MRLLRRLALLILAVMVTAAHPAWAAREMLTIGITQFPSTFNPALDPMMAKTYVLGMTRRPLTVHDAGWQVVCMLCTELPTFENGRAVAEDLPGGGKGVALTFTIHPKASWGDGVPVTSRDVAFTWEVGRHPQSGVTNGELFRRITAIDVKDDRTFVLHLDKLTFDYNALNDFEVLPVHLEAEAFAEPAEYRHRTRYDTDTANPGLWFGPYRITQVARGSHVVLERNPAWWGAPPAFARIVVKAVENTAALEANLLSGQVDMIAGEMGLSIDQAIAFEKRHRARFAVTFKPSLIFEHVDLNLDNPILADRRVRQALLLGLDRQGLVDQLFDGRQPVAHSNVSPLDRMYSAEVPAWPHDPARAAALLDEAGWTAGPGGMRRNAKGEPLALELITTAGNRSRELVQQVLQGQWRKLGVDVRIRNEPARVLFGETLQHRSYGAMALFAWISAPESVPRTTLHSEMIPAAANGWSGQNLSGYRDAAMDSLIDRIEMELDEGRRRALWAELQALYARDLPALPLFWRADAHILPRWLGGVTPTGHQYPTTLWVEHWTVQPGQ